MDFKKIIKEQKEELEKIEQKERIIPREGFETAKKALAYPNILAILGIRRCGKSIFSNMLAKNENSAYLNFDDERLAGLQTEDFDKILSSFYELYDDIDYIIFDEIQNVKNWELFLNRMRRTKRVIITGSNSNLLSGELSTHLTGRYLDLKLFPFSFREFLTMKGITPSKVKTTKEEAEIIRAFEEYLRVGGFPEVYKFGTIMASRIYEDVLTKDILLRYKIKKPDEFKKMAKYIVSNSSKEITYRKLREIVGLKQVSSISKWMLYLENSFLIFKIERFAFKLKEQFKAPKKIYCIDQGIINSIGFAFSENRGQLLECIAAIELQRRKSRKAEMEIYYWKDYQQSEVDFVVKTGRKIEQLIQVSSVSSKEEIQEREVKSLLIAKEELRCGNLLVLTWNYEHTGKDIKFIPLWKWLIEA